MTTVRIRIGAGIVNHRQDVIDWLEHNVGPFNQKKDVPRGYDFIGEGWLAAWRQFGGGWFMDVTFTDPKHAAFFTLRWK